MYTRSSFIVQVILVKFYSNEFSQQVSEKHTNIKFHENPSKGSRVVSCVLTDGRANGHTDRQIEKSKLNVAFGNFANTSKNDFLPWCLFVLPFKLLQYNDYKKGRTIDDTDFDYRLRKRHFNCLHRPDLLRGSTYLIPIK